MCEGFLGFGVGENIYIYIFHFSLIFTLTHALEKGREVEEKGARGMHTDTTLSFSTIIIIVIITYTGVESGYNR